MPKRLVGVLVLLAAFAALATGCAWSATQQSAPQPSTKIEASATPAPQGFVAAGAAVTARRTGIFLQYITKEAAPATDDNSGMALVQLFPTGTAVGATCPVRGLVQGDKIAIQQFPQSVWIVTGKL